MGYKTESNKLIDTDNSTVVARGEGGEDAEGKRVQIHSDRED